MKNLTTRDTLLQIRTFVSEDGTRADKIKELSQQLDTAITERSEAANNALGILENYVVHQSEIHGFNNDLEDLVVASSVKQKSTKKASKKKASKKKASKKKASKKRKTVTGRNGGPQKALGYPGTLCESITLSEKEQAFVDILRKKWPMFTTTKSLAREGIIPVAAHATAKVNQLRKKGVPIESARQARLGDESLSSNARGYRLINDNPQ